MNNEITMPLLTIDRHRLMTDGTGVTTLVASYGCPLSCKYCLNPYTWAPEVAIKSKKVTPKELYEKVKIDNLYFMATNGGVTFGGGESLLHADFIRKFRNICGDDWNITVETSLNVPTKNLETVIGAVTDYIVDIKDMNPEIYKAYTGIENDRVIKNLSVLAEHVGKEHVVIRIPFIPKYNSKEDVEKSVALIQEMGFTNLDVFHYVIRENKYKNKIG